LSPDGATLAFVAEPSGSKQRRLFVRALHELQATALPGTEGAEHPFFSPDGRWIGFFASGKLKKVAAGGGTVASLCDAPRGRGGSWAEDGTIIFAPDIDVGFHRVSADGGKAVPLGADGFVAGTYRWPQVLPGGRGVVFTRNSSPFATSRGFDHAEVAVTPLPSGPPRTIVRNAYYGQYLPSGHLIYVQGGRLFAVRFDIESLEVKGQPAPILEAVGASRGSGGAQVAFSSEGTLVYLPESVYDRSIDWLTRAGERFPLHEGPLDWTSPRLSPDGNKLALDVFDGNQSDIWIFDLERGTQTQLTFDAGNDLEAVWSPDGRRIVFSSDRGQMLPNLYWMNADGTNEARRLTQSLQAERAGSWHPGGQWISFDSAGDAKTREDLRLLPVREDGAGGLNAGEPVDFLKSPAREARPMFSPDGRWIAYTSDESGDFEILVRPFPGPGGQWRVSRKGGMFPRWARHEPHLLFPGRDLVMFAKYEVQGASFWSSEPEPWSPAAYLGSGGAYPYDVHPDGRRLVVNVDRKENSRNTLAFAFGFFDYLKDLLPDDEGNKP
jgi:serine/threonine-protein kinase